MSALNDSGSVLAKKKGWRASPAPASHDLKVIPPVALISQLPKHKFIVFEFSNRANRTEVTFSRWAFCSVERPVIPNGGRTT